jgi:hypothetical protein
MRYHVLVPALMLATFSASCSGNKKTAAADPVAPAPAAQADQAATPTAAPAVTPLEEAATLDSLGVKSAQDSVWFQLKRTPCFGTCPVYTITVLEDGRATYSGGRFAPRQGEYAGKVGAETMEKLWSLAEEAGFFGLQDKYDGAVTDLPSTIMRFHGKGKDKRVVGRVGTPTSFRVLAEAAEELLSPVEWTLVKEQ